MLRKKAPLVLCSAAMVALLCGSAMAQVEVPVSGYEIFLGHNCIGKKIGGDGRLSGR